MNGVDGGGGIDGHNWRGGGGGGAGPGAVAGGGGAEAGATAALARGELQQADQHLRDHFTLFLYVPTEQVGVIIGKKGAKIQYIQTATNTRVVMAANASKEWESAWFQVMVKGTASGCYAASKIIASLVDEMDDCVAQFHLPRGKHAAFIRKSGATIRRISADTNVRIFVPGRKEEGGDIQLEGEVSNVMKALALITTAVYGAWGGGKKGEHDVAAATGAVGNGEEAGKGKQQQQQSKREKLPQQQADAEEAGPVEPEGPVVEELLVFPLRELRVLTQGKKGAPMAVISRMTGSVITKEAKPRKEPEKEKEKEGGSAGEEEVAGAAAAAANGAAVAMAEEDEEERPVKVHVSGVQAQLTAAVEALRAVAGGAPLKEVQDSLRAQGFTGSGGGGGGDKKKGRSGKGKGKGNAAGSGPAAVPTPGPASSSTANNGPAPAAAPAAAGGSAAGL